MIRKAYDAALTAFSGKIMPRIEYEMDAPAAAHAVLNSTDKLYRYYDATPQAEYLYDAVAETIRARISARRLSFLKSSIG